MLFVIAGAAGSGKSTLVPLLRAARPSVRWHDFDERWRGGGLAERHHLLEGWIRSALDHGGDVGLLGPLPLGELLAAPSTPRLPGVRHLLLDVGDVERIRRLRERGDGHTTQETLNWAAWLRAHEAYPDWRPDVIMRGGGPAMRWERWHDRPAVPWPGATLDATGLTPQDTARRRLARVDGAAASSHAQSGWPVKMFPASQCGV